MTISETPTLEGDTVTAPVAFAAGGTGRVTYTVTPDGEGSNVNVKLEQDLGANPMNRFAAITQLHDTITCSGRVTALLEQGGETLAQCEIQAVKANGEQTLVGEALVAL